MEDHDLGDDVVEAENTEFIVLPAQTIDKHWRDEIGLTPEQIKNPDAFAYCSDFNEATETVTFRVFIGKRLSGDMRKLAKKHGITYDRMCRAFFCNMLCLETVSKPDDEIFALTVFNTAHSLLEPNERAIMIQFVRNFIKDHEIDGRAFPRQIHQLLNP